MTILSYENVWENSYIHGTLLSIHLRVWKKKVRTCWRLGVDEIEVAIWKVTLLPFTDASPSEEDDDEEVFDWELLSNWKLSCLFSSWSEGRRSTESCSNDSCWFTGGVLYSKGFVIAINEFKISGVLGVFAPKSMPSMGELDIALEKLKLYIFPQLSARSLQCVRCALSFRILHFLSAGYRKVPTLKFESILRNYIWRIICIDANFRPSHFTLWFICVF